MAAVHPTLQDAPLPDSGALLRLLAELRATQARALRAGASGYVLKESAGGEVVDAVRAVHSGRRFLSEKLSSRVLDDYIREREVGALLGLSPKSVDTYRSRMMNKLDIQDWRAW